MTLRHYSAQATVAKAVNDTVGPMVWLMALLGKIAFGTLLYALMSGLTSKLGQQPLSLFPGWTVSKASVLGMLQVRSPRAEVLRHADYANALIAPQEGSQWRVSVPRKRFEAQVSGDRDTAISHAISASQR